MVEKQKSIWCLKDSDYLYITKTYKIIIPKITWYVLSHDVKMCNVLYCMPETIEINI